MESTTSIARELKTQAELYRFLAAALCSHPAEESVRILGAITAELGIPCPSDLSLTDLDREYMELFAIPGPRYVAPYESVFRDHWLLPPKLKRGSDPRETGQTVKGLLMGESTLAVRKCYLRSGLLPKDELPDHISNELYFLAHLCEREAEAEASEARTLAESRERFQREHVLKWIGELRQKVGERDRLGYYHAVLRAAEALLREEAD